MIRRKSRNMALKMATVESTTVEWKQSLSEVNEIIETGAGFANTKGGRIFIGVSPEGKIFGVQIGKVG